MAKFFYAFALHYPWMKYSDSIYFCNFHHEIAMLHENRKRLKVLNAKILLVKVIRIKEKLLRLFNMAGNGIQW